MDGFPVQVRYAISSKLKRLGFQWSEEGSAGTILEWVSRGQDRSAYLAEDIILKISEHNQEREKEIAQQLPGIAAKVYWGCR